MKNALYILIVLFTTTIFSCKKSDFLENGGKIEYSVDTLLFDTVFTHNPTSTRSILIYNNENKKINISSLSLARGANSPFYFNVNGQSGYTAKDIEIGPKDSAWVFFGANIDTTMDDLPFVVEDELIATMNGSQFKLPIMAMAQNVVYIVDSVLSTQTWNSNRPYVIVNNALISPDEVLTIKQGTKVYVNGNSRLYIQGTLRIEGTLDEPVMFQGDRIDRAQYIGGDFGVGGEWGGLYFFSTSKDNYINYAQFINGGSSTKIGSSSTIAATIQLDEDTLPPTNPKLTILNTIIKNSQGYGIVAFGSSMYAENCLIVECGAENLAMVQGGNYEINNCTIANYGWNYNRRDKTGTFAATNFFSRSANDIVVNPLNAKIQNSIIYGSFENELYVDKMEQAPASVLFNNCLLKNKDGIEDYAQINNSLQNQNPKFKQIPSGSNYTKWDYQLEDDSPAKNAGINIGNLSKDLIGADRIAPYTIGCYQ